MVDGRTAVALLAAGEGNRFGGGKLDADLCGKPVGLWAARAAEAAGFARRIIVVPPQSPSFVSALSGWEHVTNPHPDKGMAGSIRAAAVAAADAERLVVMLADMPLVETEHLLRLSEGSSIAFTHYGDGRRGVPAGFPAEAFAALANLKDGQSPAGISWGMGVKMVATRMPGTLMDIDTPGDLAFAKSMLCPPTGTREV